MKKILIAVYGASGAGKDTIVNNLCKINENLFKIVRHTTRPKRPNEKDGFDYHFVSTEVALSLPDNEVLEMNNHNNWFYYTDVTSVSEGLNIGSFSEEATFSLLEYAKDKDDLEVIPVRVNCSKKTRLYRALERGGDIDETIRRFYFESKEKPVGVEPVSVISNEQNLGNLTTEEKIIYYQDILIKILSDKITESYI